MKTILGKTLKNKQYMPVLMVVMFLAMLVSDVYGEAWVAKAIGWSQSFAEATIPGGHAVDNSGVVLFQQSTATAGPLIGPESYAYAHAHSRNLWGGNVVVIATGKDASAGSGKICLKQDNPDPTGELDYDVSENNGILTISGSASYQKNASLELSVLDVNGLTASYVSNIFLLYKGVQYAVDANYISEDRVLFTIRGDGLPVGNFNYNVNVGSMDLNDVAVSSIGHAASNVPTLSQWGLIIMGMLLLTAGAIVIQRRLKTVPA